MSSTPKPSGPLWAWADSSGEVQIGSLSPIEGTTTRFPVRVIPGHGKAVPMELVSAIAKAWDKLDQEADDRGYVDRAADKLDAAIHAAIDGAL